MGMEFTLYSHDDIEEIDMRKPDKWILAVVCIIVSVVIGGTITVKFIQRSKENKAIQIATEYLEQKYEQKMVYQRIRYSWIDPSLYHVTFSPESHPDISFEVLIQNDLTLRNNIQEFRQTTSPDNYYLKYFEYLMTEFLSDDINRLWNDTASITVLQHNIGLYSFTIPFELNDSMSLQDMESLISNYWIYIQTTEALESSHDFENAAFLLYEFFQVLKNNSFSPDVISFKYVVSENKTESVI